MDVKYICKYTCLILNWIDILHRISMYLLKVARQTTETENNILQKRESYRSEYQNEINHVEREAVLFITKKGKIILG